MIGYNPAQPRRRGSASWRRWVGLGLWLTLRTASAWGQPWGEAALEAGTKPPQQAQLPASVLRVDAVVMSVAGRVVTESDLELEARLVLVGGGGVGAAFGSLDGATLKSVQDYLINQLLILAEVDRLGVFEVNPAELAQAFAELKGRFKSARAFELFLQAQDVGLDRVRAILKRNLRVGRYLDTRVKMSVSVTEEESRDFFNANKDRFATGASFPAVRELIRSYLFEARYNGAVKKMLQRLRAHGEVERLQLPAGFAAVPSEAPVAEERLPSPEVVLPSDGGTGE